MNSNSLVTLVKLVEKRGGYVRSFNQQHKDAVRFLDTIHEHCEKSYEFAGIYDGEIHPFFSPTQVTLEALMGPRFSDDLETKIFSTQHDILTPSLLLESIEHLEDTYLGLNHRDTFTHRKHLALHAPNDYSYVPYQTYLAQSYSLRVYTHISQVAYPFDKLSSVKIFGSADQTDLHDLDSMLIVLENQGYTVLSMEKNVLEEMNKKRSKGEKITPFSGKASFPPWWKFPSLHTKLESFVHFYALTNELIGEAAFENYFLFEETEGMSMTNEDELVSALVDNELEKRYLHDLQILDAASEDLDYFKFLFQQAYAYK